MISFHIFSGTFLSIPARFCLVFAIFKVKLYRVIALSLTTQIRSEIQVFLTEFLCNSRFLTQTFDISLLLLSLVRSESRREGLKSKTTSLLFLSAIGDFQSCTQLSHLKIFKHFSISQDFVFVSL